MIFLTVQRMLDQGLAMTPEEKTALYKQTFNTVAEGYDNPSTRFFRETAANVPQFLELQGDERVLDLATGTGNTAFEIAAKLSSGKVVGVDISDGMLALARERAAAEQVSNIEFLEMDIQQLRFAASQFDIATSAFSLFFVDDMCAQLTHIQSKVKPGGRILFTSFGEGAFSPMMDLFLERIEIYGITPPSISWKQVACAEDCTQLLQAANLHAIQHEKIDQSFYLADANGWWDIVWNAGFRGMVERLSVQDREKFKREHLAEVQTLADENGILLAMPILYTWGLVAR